MVQSSAQSSVDFEVRSDCLGPCSVKLNISKLLNQQPTWAIFFQWVTTIVIFFLKYVHLEYVICTVPNHLDFLSCNLYVLYFILLLHIFMKPGLALFLATDQFKTAIAQILCSIRERYQGPICPFFSRMNKTRTCNLSSYIQCSSSLWSKYSRLTTSHQYKIVGKDHCLTSDLHFC